jgi:hypothetical protein
MKLRERFVTLNKKKLRLGKQIFIIIKKYFQTSA